MHASQFAQNAPGTVNQDINQPLYPTPPGARGTGISTYDWLAALAMQGLMTRGMEVRGDRAMTEEEKDIEMAQRAYRVATAMMQARREALQGQAETQPSGH
jgi:hypothetical protein